MTYRTRDSGNVKIIDPRGLIHKKGAEHLTDHELLALILGSGTKSHNVMRLAEILLLHLEKNNYSVDVESLLEIKGLGLAKSTRIVAMLELCKRMLLPSSKRIESPKDILPLLHNYAHKEQEYFLSIILNGAHNVISHSIVSIGLINKTLVHPREVFSDAIRLRATSLIIAHNHPSGYVEPSSEDLQSTRRIKESGILLGIPLLDHIIFSPQQYYSFKEHGKI